MKPLGILVLVIPLVAAMASPASAGPQIAPHTEKFVLSGVVVVDGGKGLAWLQEPTLTGNQVVPLRPGESLGPYRLTRILDDRVELEGPSGTVLVPVQGGSASGVAVARETPPSVARPTVVEAGAAGTPQHERRGLLQELREARREARQARFGGQTGGQSGAQGQFDKGKSRGGRRGSKDSAATASSDSPGASATSNQSAASNPPAHTGIMIPRGDPRRSQSFMRSN